MILGLTGGIASGKSTVVAYLKMRGIPICDTDMIARDVVLPGSVGLKRLVEMFGDDIIDKKGVLKRAVLADKIFCNEVERNKLNSVLHPLIFERVEQFKKTYSQDKLAVIDMPLLFETGYHKKVDQVMVIDVDEAIQYERLMKRNGLTRQQAKERIAAQMPLNEKKELADSVIDNNGTIEKTYEQIEKFLKVLEI